MPVAWKDLASLNPIVEDTPEPEVIPRPPVTSWSQPTGTTGVPGSAADRFAAVTREQWQDYMTRFFPLEDKLIGLYKNPEQRKQRIATATGLSESAFGTATQGSQMEAARYGLNLDSPAYQRQLNMERVAANVDAANEARRHLTARDQMIMTGLGQTKSAVLSR